MLVRFRGIEKTFDGVTLVIKDLDLDIYRGRVPDPARSLGIGQDDDPDDARRLRDADPRRDRPRRPADRQPASPQARHRHGVPELRAVPAHDGGGERRLSAAGAQAAQGRDQVQGGPRLGDRPARHPRRPPSQPALRRPATAHRHGPGVGVRAQAGADGRTARRPRQAASRADADRDQAHPRKPRRDRGLRHPRPGRGADHVRPGRRGQRRDHPAARRPRPGLRGAAERLRRPLHRREQPAAGPGRGDRERHLRGRARRRLVGAGTVRPHRWCGLADHRQPAPRKGAPRPRCRRLSQPLRRRGARADLPRRPHPAPPRRPRPGGVRRQGRPHPRPAPGPPRRPHPTRLHRRRLPGAGSRITSSDT